MQPNSRFPDDDELVEAFATEWQQVSSGSNRPELERYLSTELPAVAQRTRLLALLSVELARRLALHESPSADEYVRRLPRFREIIESEFNQLLNGGGSDVSTEIRSDVRLVEPEPRQRKPPKRIGQYQIEGQLGAGAFGVVYRGFDPELERHVAIKVPHLHRLRKLGDSSSFRAEARSLAALDHPAIVRVLHVGQEGERFFIVTEFVDGGDLKSRLESGRVSPLEAATYARTIASGLHHAHAHGFIHRDLKPANILLDGDDRPRIADFGLALNYAHVGEGPKFAGSIPYMSPEQAREEGHRVDGRSDIFSLGILLYQLLTGERPFRADDPREVLDQIINMDPRPPRQVDDSISRELERICLKALAKRVVDRYSCARDLQDDLDTYLESRAEGSQSSASQSTHATETAIVPKGLRTFDATDADSFLKLLPGPSDREGLPEAIRFWKQRIESETDTSLQVGLVYGPSGCGKSSLVRAGLLPRLAGHIVPLYVEATPEGTEKNLLRLIAKHFPDCDETQDLPTALSHLRSGDLLSQAKLLIVVDQFEQWLHGNPTSHDRLVRALRQCDGEHVQCLLIVRDDFWLGVSRFMGELEIPLLEGTNSLLIDLFDTDHAQRVLSRFGAAYSRLPTDPRELTPRQHEFLTVAIDLLAVEGRVVPVQLAMLVEMLKNKEWTRATLAEFGGSSGIGVAFLKATFESVVTLVKHRAHRNAAAAVLESLLPQTSSDLKGKMRSRDELLQAAGYSSSEPAFDELLRILDQELRLITPSDSVIVDRTTDAVSQPQRMYQLTHDYLVPSLREWLARSKATTRQGRAELLLAERAAQWSTWTDDRFLPTLQEFLMISVWTRRRRRDSAQKEMMSRATRRHGVRLGFVGLLFAAVLTVTWYTGNRELEGLANRLIEVDPTNVLNTVEKLAGYGDRGKRLLMQKYQVVSGNQRLHIAVALLPGDPYLAEVERVLLDGSDDDTSRFVLARDALLPHKSSVVPDLRQVIDEPSGSLLRRFRATCALAHYERDAGADPRVTETIVGALVALDAAERRRWRSVLQLDNPMLRERLLDEIRASNSSYDRSRVFEVVRELFPQHSDVHYTLIANATPAELGQLLPLPEDHQLAQRLRDRLSASREELRNERESRREKIVALEARVEQGDQQSMERQAELHNALLAIELKLVAEQASIAIALLTSSEPQTIWPLFRSAEPGETTDIGVQSEVLHRLASAKLAPSVFVSRLAKVTATANHDAAEVRWLLLAVGRCTTVDKPLTEEVQKLARHLFQSDPDPGVHSVAEWLLRTKRIELPEISSDVREDRRWMLGTGSRIFSILGPVSTTIGSPKYEPNRGREQVEFHPPLGPPVKQRIEEQRTVDLARFAICTKEVSVAEFQEFFPDYRPIVDVVESSTREDPAQYITWEQAGAYCNALSQEEGLEPAYDETSKRYDVSKLGYRLPTSAEWEYASRGRVSAAWYPGDCEHVLGDYAWYLDNSGKKKFLPGGSLIPNSFGLFDTLGNVAEWCAGRVHADGDVYWVARGGAYDDPAIFLRSAVVLQMEKGVTHGSSGFRLAKTTPE